MPQKAHVHFRQLEPLRAPLDRLHVEREAHVEHLGAVRPQAHEVEGVPVEDPARRPCNLVGHRGEIGSQECVCLFGVGWVLAAHFICEKNFSLIFICFSSFSAHPSPNQGQIPRLGNQTSHDHQV